MAIDIVPRIKLDGEKDFKAALKGINTELKLAQSEMKKVTAVYNDNAGSVDALRAKGEALSDKLSAQSEKVDKLRDMVRQATEVYGENTDKVAEWQAKLNNAEAELAKLNSEVDKNKAALKEAENAQEKSNSVFGKAKSAYDNARQSVKEFADEHPKLTKAISASKEAAEGFAKVAAKSFEAGAKVTAAAVGAVAAGAVAVGKAVWDASKEASEAGNVIDKASQRMGTSAEKYQELSYAAQLSGVSMGTMETAAKNLAKSGSDLTLDEAIKELQGISDESERAAKAQELFGSKAAYAMTTLLNDGAGGFEQMAKAAHEYGLIMSDEAVEASAKFQDTLSTMTGTLSTIKNNLAAEFMPGLNEVMEGVTGLFTGDEGAPEKIKKGIEDVVNSLDEVVGVVLNIAGNLIDAFVDVAPDIISTLCDGLIRNVEKLVKAAVELVQTLATSLLTADNIKLLINAALSMVKSLMEALINPDALKTMINGALEFVNAVTQFIIENAPIVIGAAVELVTELISGLTEGDGLKTLIHGALDMVLAITTALLDNVDELIEAGLELALALADALLTYDWWGLAKKIFVSIKDSIKSFFTGGDNEDGSHAAGISYVPYDDYNAVLHEGERVLTAAENKAYSERGRSDEEQKEEIRALRREVIELGAILKGGIGVDVTNSREMAREIGRRALA